MRYLLFLFSLLVTPALGQTPVVHPLSMSVSSIDMTVVLHDDAGKPIADQYVQTSDDPSCSKCGSLTLGHAVAHALFAAFPDEKDLSGEQKWARGVLAEQIKNEPKAQLSSAQIVVIKALVGKLYNGVIVTQIFKLLDPNATPPALLPVK